MLPLTNTSLVTVFFFMVASSVAWWGGCPDGTEVDHKQSEPKHANGFPLAWQHGFPNGGGWVGPQAGELAQK